MVNSQLPFTDLALKGLGRWAFLRALAYILLFYLLFSFLSISLMPLVEEASGTYQIALLLLSFYGLLWGLYFAIVQVHHRQILEAFTGNSFFRFSLMFKSWTVFFLLCILGDMVYASLLSGEYIWNFSLSKFIPVLLIALFAIPIQTTAEELLIRSYIIQSISLFIKNRYIVAIISAAIFAVLHGANVELAHFGKFTMLMYYFLFGLFLAFVTIASNGLEIAMGIHAATNMYSFTIVSFQGSSLETDTLFKLNEPNAIIMLWLVIISMLLFLALFRKKFSLNYFKSRP
jgi:uncharacterized protein